MNQVKLGIHITSHITCSFSWGKALCHLTEAKKSVQSEKAQITKVSLLGCSTAFWELDGAVWRGKKVGDRFMVELAELEKWLEFLSQFSPPINPRPTVNYPLQS